MSAWKVYILRCADGTLYTGITNQLAARLKAHNGAGGAKYTRARRPVVLVWSTSCKSQGAALSLEHENHHAVMGSPEPAVLHYGQSAPLF